MERTTLLGLGGLVLLAAATGARGWQTREVLLPPDAEGIRWTDSPVTQRPASIEAPPKAVRREPRGPAVIPHTVGWSSPRWTVTFPGDGARVRVDVRSVSSAARHEVIEHDVTTGALLRYDAQAKDAPEGDGRDAEGVPLWWKEPALGRSVELGGGTTLELVSELRAKGWSPDGRTLAIVKEDALVLWDAERGLRRLSGAPSALRGTVCTPDGRKVLTGDLRLIDLVSGEVRVLRGKTSDYLSAATTAFRREGTEVAIGHGFAGVERIDLRTGLPLGPLVVPSRHPTWSVRAVEAKWAIAKGIPYGDVYDVFDLETGATAFELPNVFRHGEGGADSAAIAATENGRYLARWFEARLELRDLREHRGWRVRASSTNNELVIRGSMVHGLGVGSLETWDIQNGAVRRTAYLDLPGEWRLDREAISRGGDRVVLPSGRIVAIDEARVVDGGPAGLAAADYGYHVTCWGEGDRFVVLSAGDVLLLHRPAPAATLLVQPVMLATRVELLVRTPEGYFDASDELLETLWVDHEGKPRRASSLPELRRRGLLAAFHAGR